MKVLFKKSDQDTEWASDKEFVIVKGDSNHAMLFDEDTTIVVEGSVQELIELYRKNVGDPDAEVKIQDAAELAMEAEMLKTLI